MNKRLVIALFLVIVFIGLSSLWQGSKVIFPEDGKITITISPAVNPAISQNPSIFSSEREKVQVSRVIDGDTVELTDGRRVRYIGIDTPETVDPRKTVQCFGREASNKNKELVEGKTVELEKDISETDKYGRLLRYIYVDDPSTSSGQAIFVNDYLVRQGFAHASSYPPDIKYQSQLQEAEREAWDNGRGLWSACGGEKATTTGGECQIKGNISSSGEKIYHRPDCPYWSKTVISEEKGERWFCLEEEARSAGWRMAQNCP